MSVIPKCTSWLGHNFKARYSISAATFPPGLKGEFEIGVAALQALRSKTYHGEVCVRCGYRIDAIAPNNSVNSMT